MAKGTPRMVLETEPKNFPLFNAQTLLGDVDINSQEDGQFANKIQCGGYRHFSLELTIISTGSPTDIEFFVEFSNNGGANWAHHAQGLFASLVFSDAEVTALKREIYTGDVVGDWFRLRVLGQGISGGNDFTFNALVRFWK